MVRKIRENEPFQYFKYGDGEFVSMLQLKPPTAVNSSKHHYFKSLGERMKSTLLPGNEHGPNAMIGIQNWMRLGRRPYSKLALKWIQDNAPHITWCSTDTLHYANRDGKLKPFVDALRTRDTVGVGPKWISKLKIFKRFIEVPGRDCYKAIDRIMDDIQKDIEANENPLFLFSSSLPTNVMMHRFCRSHPHITMVSCGSIWDPYVGKPCRSYHRLITPKIKKANGMI